MYYALGYVLAASVAIWYLLRKNKQENEFDRGYSTAKSLNTEELELWVDYFSLSGYRSDFEKGIVKFIEEEYESKF